jgi:F-box and WD-40 domain protein CDC4
MTISPGSQKEPRRPKSSQTTVSVSFGEDARRHRFQFEVSECVETKTVTTTTTTKRSFPPVFVREPRPLAALDAKEYPLASKPTPPELARFTFDLPGLEPLVDEPANHRTVSTPYLFFGSHMRAQPPFEQY